MPICFVPGDARKTDEDDAVDKASAVLHPEWREPPGYLGEAVRRAKRIASLSRPAEKTKDC